jgi:uncharacterized protein involved in type VI secretion and phage assembly
VNLSGFFPLETTLEAGGNVKGVAVAIVRENRDDSGMCRVRVEYPWQPVPGESYWARVASPMGGKDRGVYFLPEIGDEVLVAFERGDVRFPYVVGSLWNGKEPAPLSNADGKNDVRQIRTRAGHMLTFDDGANGRVQLELSDGKRLTFDRDGIALDDGQGNRVQIASASGAVTIEAAATLTLKAPRIAIDADATLTLSASGPLTASGTPISLN